jgi:predicted dehydrogenase
MSRLRVGVVGVGHLGRHHARILAGLEGAHLVAVADSRIEQARAVAEPLGAEAFDDYRALLGRVDAVSVAVPTTAHREVAGAFLERGIPTLVEKPLAAAVAEAEELVALARRRDAVLQVGHIERFNPALKALERAPLRPKFIQAERLGLYTFRSTDIGVVHDLMIHDLDLVLSMVEAPVAAVSALGVSVFGGHEDVANARIWFEDGTVADLSASRASLHAVRKMWLWGAEGFLGLDFAARQARAVRPSEALRRGELDVEGVDLADPKAVRDHLFGKVLEMDEIRPDGCDQLTEELKEFAHAAATGACPTVTGDDALRALRLADRITRAIEAHAWEGAADGPTGPRLWSAPHDGPPEPKFWRLARTPRPAPHNGREPA